jgi:hypothetical protein
MARKNWDKIAKEEFEAMGDDWKADWADLQQRVSKR